MHFLCVPCLFCSINCQFGSKTLFMIFVYCLVSLAPNIYLRNAGCESKMRFSFLLLCKQCVTMKLRPLAKNLFLSDKCGYCSYVQWPFCSNLAFGHVLTSEEAFLRLFLALLFKFIHFACKVGKQSNSLHFVFILQHKPQVEAEQPLLSIRSAR